VNSPLLFLFSPLFPPPIFAGDRTDMVDGRATNSLRPVALEPSFCSGGKTCARSQRLQHLPFFFPSSLHFYSVRAPSALLSRGRDIVECAFQPHRSTACQKSRCADGGRPPPIYFPSLLIWIPGSEEQGLILRINGLAGPCPGCSDIAHIPLLRLALPPGWIFPVFSFFFFSPSFPSFFRDLGCSVSTVFR